MYSKTTRDLTEARMQLVPSPFPSNLSPAYACLETPTMTGTPLHSRVDLHDPETCGFHQQTVKPPQHHAVLVPTQSDSWVMSNDNSQLTETVSALQQPFGVEMTQFMLPLITQHRTDHFGMVDLARLADCMQWQYESETSTLRISSWLELPGRCGSFIRLREVADWGRGMVFFSWANHRRMEFPDKPEMIMEFQNFSVLGGPHIITLQPEDALAWCPAKYLWPACVVCGKFLFPCDGHRHSYSHQKKMIGWWPNLREVHDVYMSRNWYARAFVEKNVRGLSNPW
jgi:hypothetical protein